MRRLEFFFWRIASLFTVSKHALGGSLTFCIAAAEAFLDLKSDQFIHRKLFDRCFTWAQLGVVIPYLPMCCVVASNGCLWTCEIGASFCTPPPRHKLP